VFDGYEPDGAERLERGTAWLRVVGATVVVVLGGEHDMSTADDVERAIRAAEARDPALIAIDLEPCDFIDSTVVRTLLYARERALADGRRLALLVPAGGSIVARTLELSGLAEVLSIYPTLSDALRAGSDGSRRFRVG
jgi:anti-sigma B factor antagonist